ncbi:GNAT family N-acetyltransferase [Roseibium sp.]|uniref:GNAT family N-acetyltransferase n=1 Tax=Roseibium sp. TaxID=1936156 RepID=UPI003A977F45
MPGDLNTIVTLAGPNDKAAIAALMAAMDLHYQGSTLGNLEEQIARVDTYMDEADNGTSYAIARLEGEPAGIACFTLFRNGLIHPGSVFLKDLFVLNSARGNSIGQKLMEFVARYAHDKGADRIDLSVDVPNTGAAHFYEPLGGKAVDSKRFFRFSSEAVASLAGRS